MSWLWLDVPLAAALFMVWVAASAWLVRACGRGGNARCGLPAAVEYRYTVATMTGLRECAKIRCPRGHWFNGPVEALIWDKHPTAGPARTRIIVDTYYPPAGGNHPR